MTDRELLELAAKAAGLRLDQLSGRVVRREADGQPVYWNPLTDNGDALRLAVKLRLVVDSGGVTPRNERIYVGGLEGYLADEPTGTDIYAATRRAIVRAAAELGKEMK
jgi:hypothetical protein